ncbi:MAG: energy-coupling factor transporter ATPase [Phascolarctobacterium sp.]
MSIKLSHIYHTYSKATPFERLALQDVSLEITKGEIVAIIGHTGSGKSTLVQHLNGLLQPDKGTATIDEVDISAKGVQAKNARQQVGMVFQYPEHQIFAETVFEDIAFGPRNKGFSEEEVAKQVREAMDFVGLDYDTFAQRSPFQLSGGQMRRVAIAGVVAMNPDYLVLDEPSAGLDPRSRNAVFREIMSLHKSRGIAIVLVTHSMEEAVKYANRLLVINGGRVLFDGEPAAIFKEHGPELVQVGVDVPQVYKLADLLRQKGIALPEGIKDEMALVKAIKKAKGWK